MTQARSSWLRVLTLETWRDLVPALVVLCVHCLAAEVQLYDRISALDVLMHLAGGYTIAWWFDAVVRAAADAGRITRPDPVLRRILLFALVGTATVLWEFGEFATDRLFAMSEQRTLEDTLADMALGLLGGLVYLAHSRGRAAAGPVDSRAPTGRIRSRPFPDPAPRGARDGDQHP